MLIAINERVVLVLFYLPKHLDICFLAVHRDGDTDDDDDARANRSDGDGGGDIGTLGERPAVDTFVPGGDRVDQSGLQVIIVI